MYINYNIIGSGQRVRQQVEDIKILQIHALDFDPSQSDNFIRLPISIVRNIIT